MVVTMLGDLKHGRTVHSLAKLLCHFTGIKLQYVAPSILGMPEDVRQKVDTMGVQQVEVSILEDAIVNTDVLYVTRIQKERFETEADYDAVAGSYCVNAAIMSKAKRNMIVMHPLPRVDEISPEIDDDPRSAYFRQMENGMHMRMAILSLVMLGRV